MRFCYLDVRMYKQNFDVLVNQKWSQWGAFEKMGKRLKLPFIFGKKKHTLFLKLGEQVYYDQESLAL